MVLWLHPRHQTIYEPSVNELIITDELENYYLTRGIMNLENLEKLTSGDLYQKLFPTFKILVFYLLVLFVTVSVGYAVMGREGLDYGLVAGVVVSGALWFHYGRDMAFKGY
mgnify:CR=1 FL=1